MPSFLYLAMGGSPGVSKNNNNHLTWSAADCSSHATAAAATDVCSNSGKSDVVHSTGSPHIIPSPRYPWQSSSVSSLASQQQQQRLSLDFLMAAVANTIVDSNNNGSNGNHSNSYDFSNPYATAVLNTVLASAAAAAAAAAAASELSPGKQHSSPPQPQQTHQQPAFGGGYSSYSLPFSDASLSSWVIPAGTLQEGFCMGEQDYYHHLSGDNGGNSSSIDAASSSPSTAASAAVTPELLLPFIVAHQKCQQEQQRQLEQQEQQRRETARVVARLRSDTRACDNTHQNQSDITRSSSASSSRISCTEQHKLRSSNPCHSVPSPSGPNFLKNLHAHEVKAILDHAAAVAAAAALNTGSSGSSQLDSHSLSPHSSSSSSSARGTASGSSHLQPAAVLLQQRQQQHLQRHLHAWSAPSAAASTASSSSTPMAASCDAAGAGSTGWRAVLDYSARGFFSEEPRQPLRWPLHKGMENDHHHLDTTDDGVNAAFCCCGFEERKLQLQHPGKDNNNSNNWPPTACCGCSGQCARDAEDKYATRSPRLGTTTITKQPKKQQQYPRSRSTKRHPQHQQQQHHHRLYPHPPCQCLHGESSPTSSCDPSTPAAAAAISAQQPLNPDCWSRGYPRQNVSHNHLNHSHQFHHLANRSPVQQQYEIEPPVVETCEGEGGSASSSNGSTPATRGCANGCGAEHGPPGANVFIFHLPTHWREEHLISAFSQFGRILSACIVRDRITQRCLGFGFVSFAKVDSAAASVVQMNGANFHGKWLKVEIKRGEEKFAAQHLQEAARRKRQQQQQKQFVLSSSSGSV